LTSPPALLGGALCCCSSAMCHPPEGRDSAMSRPGFGNGGIFSPSLDPSAVIFRAFSKACIYKAESMSVELCGSRTLYETNLVESPILQQTGLFLELYKYAQYFTSSVPQQLLSIPRVGNRLLFWRVHESDMSQSAVPSGSIAISALHPVSKTILAYPLGMSLTKIQRSLKMPFHLSCAQTVEVWL
jgi:hypothetical protein